MLAFIRRLILGDFAKRIDHVELAYADLATNDILNLGTDIARLEEKIAELSHLIRSVEAQADRLAESADKSPIDHDALVDAVKEAYRIADIAEEIDKDELADAFDADDITRYLMCRCDFASDVAEHIELDELAEAFNMDELSNELKGEIIDRIISKLEAIK